MLVYFEDSLGHLFKIGKVAPEQDQKKSRMASWKMRHELLSFGVVEDFDRWLGFGSISFVTEAVAISCINRFLFIQGSYKSLSPAMMKCGDR